MAERQYRTLSKRTVDRLAVNGKDAVFWDHALPGFGVRVYPSGAKVYVVQTRAGRAVEARAGGAPRRPLTRPGSERGRPAHRMHQGW